MKNEKILVLGVGNILLADEGIGIKAVDQLQNHTLPDNVTLLDGGTGGFHLLELFQDYSVIIIIDATIDGNAAGTVKLIEPRFSSDFPNSLSAHDIGLKDLLDSAILLGKQPKIYLITITVKDFQEIGLELTPEVVAAIPEIIEIVKKIIR